MSVCVGCKRNEALWCPACQGSVNKELLEALEEVATFISYEDMNKTKGIKAMRRKLQAAIAKAKGDQ